MKQTIKKIQKNEKETNKKIAELQKKLCIQNPEKKIITKEEKKEQKNLPKKNETKKAIRIKKNPKIVTENTKKTEILKAKNLKKKTTNDSKKEVHWFISCDGCHAYPIYGKRFKCETCKDFDLCEKCEAKYGGEHLHPFLKVYEPQTMPILIKCVLADQENK